MSIRKFLIAMVVATVATSAFALTPEHTEWAKGPASYLMTKEEQAQWKNVKSDDEAQKFIDLFWARRDPTPTTPENEFKAAFDERVRYTDDKFSYPRHKGSMSDRGKVFILFGPPSRIERATAPQPPSAGSVTEPTEMSVTWLYEGNAAMTNFGLQRAELKFTDRFGNEDYRLEPGRVNIAAAGEKVAATAITQPKLTEVPKYGQAAAPAPKPMTAPAPATPAVVPVAPAMTEFKTPAYKTAVTEFNAAKKNPYGKDIFVTYGEGVTDSGEYFVPVSIYVPKAAGFAAGTGFTLFGSVDDANGAPVAVVEEPVTLTATKDDLFVDKSLKLPAGKYHGTFGLADASGKPVAMASTDMELAGSIDKGAESVAKMILANNIFPMTEAQQPTEPYAYGGLKVVPKGDKIFSQADDLWYFIEVRNPGRAEDTTPKIQTKIDVEGTDTTGKKIKMSAPPSEATATEFKGMPNHFGIGSAIPLASFRPGSYNITIKLMDTVNKTSYTMKDAFKVVPGPAAPAPATPPAK